MFTTNVSKKWYMCIKEWLSSKCELGVEKIHVTITNSHFVIYCSQSSSKVLCDFLNKVGFTQYTKELKKKTAEITFPKQDMYDFYELNRGRLLLESVQGNKSPVPREEKNLGAAAAFPWGTQSEQQAQQLQASPQQVRAQPVQVQPAQLQPVNGPPAIPLYPSLAFYGVTPLQQIMSVEMQNQLYLQLHMQQQIQQLQILQRLQQEQQQRQIMQMLQQQLVVTPLQVPGNAGQHMPVQLTRIPAPAAQPSPGRERLHADTLSWLTLLANKVSAECKVAERDIRVCLAELGSGTIHIQCDSLPAREKIFAYLASKQIQIKYYLEREDLFQITINRDEGKKISSMENGYLHQIPRDVDSSQAEAAAHKVFAVNPAYSSSRNEGGFLRYRQDSPVVSAAAAAAPAADFRSAGPSAPAAAPAAPPSL